MSGDLMNDVFVLKILIEDLRKQNIGITTQFSGNSAVFCITELAIGGVLLEKVFLEISQNSQENTHVRVSFLIKLQHKCFPVNFPKSLRTPFLQNIYGRLLLSLCAYLRKTTSIG